MANLEAHQWPGVSSGFIASLNESFNQLSPSLVAAEAAGGTSGKGHFLLESSGHHLLCLERNGSFFLQLHPGVQSLTLFCVSEESRQEIFAIRIPRACILCVSGLHTGQVWTDSIPALKMCFRLMFYKSTLSLDALFPSGPP